jgi:tRNA threonylcarbamoyladenosine biosynthesis protein TsaB
MIILAIETTSTTASAALATESRIITEFSVNNNLTHSQTLMPMVEQMLAISGVGKKDVGLLACSCGPGSFTGLRIGAAAAKGLAFGLNLKIVPVSTLEALAYNIVNEDCLAIPIMDARRNQVYAAFYQISNGNLQCTLKPEACDINFVLEAAAKHDGKVVFLGDGTVVHKTQIEAAGFKTAAPHQLLQRAASVAMLAHKNVGRAVDSKDFEPIYLRRPQAERELNENN